MENARKGKKTEAGEEGGKKRKAFFEQALASLPVSNSSFPLPGSKPYIYDSIVEILISKPYINDAIGEKLTSTQHSDNALQMLNQVSSSARSIVWSH